MLVVTVLLSFLLLLFLLTLFIRLGSKQVYQVPAHEGLQGQHSDRTARAAIIRCMHKGGTMVLGAIRRTQPLYQAAERALHRAR
jgi:hypothetical protein